MSHKPTGIAFGIGPRDSALNVLALHLNEIITANRNRGAVVRALTAED